MVSPRRPCSKCRRRKLATPLHFSRSRGGPGGLDSWCKVCRRRYWRRWITNPLNRRKNLKRAARWRRQHREEFLQGMRRWYRAHRRQHREGVLRWRKRNSKRLRVLWRKWYAQNRRHVADVNKRWAQTHLERVREIGKLAAARRRARKRQAGGTFSAADIYLILKRQRGRCLYCSRVLRKRRYHIDHKIPLARGGSNRKSNLCCSCERCNKSKGTRTHIEFLASL